MLQPTQPTLELDQRRLMSELGDDLRAFLTTTWHCINFVDGKIRLIPYFDFDKAREIRVALIGNSSHWRIYLDVRLSMFSTTHVFPRSAILKSHDIFERINDITEVYFWVERNSINFTH